MDQKDNIRDNIVGSLLPIGVERIILFGSRSKGDQHPDSDIDLLVVTSDLFIPSSFKDKMLIKLKISDALSFLREKYSLDLLVFTRPMFDQFMKLNSSFQREINSTGTILYEKDHPGMA